MVNQAKVSYGKVWYVSKKINFGGAYYATRKGSFNS